MYRASAERQQPELAPNQYFKSYRAIKRRGSAFVRIRGCGAATDGGPAALSMSAASTGLFDPVCASGFDYQFTCGEERKFGDIVDAFSRESD